MSRRKPAPDPIGGGNRFADKGHAQIPESTALPLQSVSNGRFDMSGKRRMPILEIDALHVYYGESHALQGVSLTLDRGILAVVGRNGMGKTTLCNTIVGLTRARSGAVRFDGQDISSLHPHEITRRGIGFVPQGRLLWPSLTV